jgi:hypothetical protein
MPIKNTYNVLRWAFVTVTILGYGYLSYYYYRGYFTPGQFTTVTGVVILLIPVLVLMFRPAYSKSGLPRINLGRVAYIVPFLVFLCAFLETLLFGYTGLLTVVMLIVGFTFFLVSKSTSTISPMLVSLLAVLISVLYGVYTPSFGSDTWRDATQASQIIENSGLHGLTITHTAYPFPVVSLLYALLSLITDLNTLGSSSIMGLLYLLLVSLLVYLIARRFNIEYPHIAVVLALTTPLVLIWSVWFVPQTYALLMAILILFLKPSSLITLILAIAMILGHGGMALWTLIILILLVFTKKSTKIKILSESINMKLITVAIPFIIYVIYTTVLQAIMETGLRFLDVLHTFLFGEEIVLNKAYTQGSTLSILSVVPLIVLVVLGIAILLEYKEDVVVRLLVLVSLAGLGIGYLGSAFFPTLLPARYLGLGSVAMLSIVSPRGIQALARRERIGTYYAFSMVLLAIISFGFAGTLIPENPYTASAYGAWSITGLIKYNEAQELDKIVSLLCCNNYLIDWRAGAYLGFKYLWIQPLSRGFYDPGSRSSFIFAGSYGLLVTPEYLEDFNGILVLRISALTMSDSFIPHILEYIQKRASKENIIYSSTNFLIAFNG